MSESSLQRKSMVAVTSRPVDAVDKGYRRHDNIPG